MLAFLAHNKTVTKLPHFLAFLRSMLTTFAVWNALPTFEHTNIRIKKF
jgi:hypothetical protein